MITTCTDSYVHPNGEVVSTYGSKFSLLPSLMLILHPHKGRGSGTQAQILGLVEVELLQAIQ